MAKIKIPKIENLSKDSQALYDVLNEESDLACVLIGTSYLDQILSSMLKRFFIKSETALKLLNPIGGTLGTFVSRIDVCYCLGLISKGLFQNLNKIAEVRNKFAHMPLLQNFTDDEISKLVNSLNFPQAHVIAVGKEQALDNPEPFWRYAQNPRSRFTVVVVSMMNRLLLIGLETQRRSRRSDEWS